MARRGVKFALFYVLLYIKVTSAATHDRKENVSDELVMVLHTINNRFTIVFFV